MDPDDDRLQKNGAASGACTLGYNQNAGQRIYLRLRNDNLQGFRSYNGLINTLLHELSHNVFGPHDENFWRLFAQLKTEYLDTHRRLQQVRLCVYLLYHSQLWLSPLFNTKPMFLHVANPQTGALINGKVSSALADLTSDAMNAEQSLHVELAQDAANGALKPEERRAAARVAAEQQAKGMLREQMEAAMQREAVARPRGPTDKASQRAQMLQALEKRSAGAGMPHPPSVPTSHSVQPPVLPTVDVDEAMAEFEAARCACCGGELLGNPPRDAKLEMLRLGGISHRLVWCVCICMRGRMVQPRLPLPPHHCVRLAIALQSALPQTAVTVHPCPHHLRV